MTDKKLNQAVAENVMGWKIKKERNWIGTTTTDEKGNETGAYLESIYIVDDSGQHMSSWWAPGHSNPRTPLPDLIKDFLLVIEKMEADGLGWELKSQGGGYRATFHDRGYVHTWGADGISKGHAVSLAALRAKGVEIDG